ncbi:MAG: asparagine synthase-related protein [Pirellulales bacterium]
MPGICGIVDARSGLAEAEFGRMIATMMHHRWYGEQRYVAEHGGAAMARVALGEDEVARRRRSDAQANLVAICDGELYDGAPTSGESATSHAARLLEGIAADDRNFLTDINGSFAAAIWDEDRSRLTLCNDRFGSRPMYYVHRDGRFAFSSSIAALIAGGVAPAEVNLKGVSQFFTFGHYFGDDTSVADVRVLPAGAWFTYDVETDRLETDRYHRLEDPRPTTQLRGDELLDRLDQLFHAAVQRRTQDAEGLGLALSGGLDARTILGVIDGSPSRVTSVCYGLPGSLDDRASRAMTSQLGSPYRNYVLSADFLTGFRDHLTEMVRLTDGQYLSQCIVMPTLPMYREWGIAALLRGHAGELLHMRKAYNYSIDAEALAISTQANLESWLQRRLPAYILDGLDAPVFRPNVEQEIAGLARQSLQEAIAPLSEIESAPQRIWHLFLTGRLRRETSLAMVKFRSVVEPRLPYLDNELVDLLLATPVEHKLGDEIQSHILRARRPGFLKIVNANTGAPMGSGRLHSSIASFRKRVFAKLGLPGYQPYERLGLWLRREAAPVVRDILLDEQCLARPHFSPDGIRSAVEAHLTGRRNHTFLLMALMVFELGQRRFAELARSTGDRSPIGMAK